MTASSMTTHTVFNQSPPLTDINLFTTDRCLQETVVREGASRYSESLSRFGAHIGQASVLDLGRQANSHLPVLHSFDDRGHRRDEVEFHPAYHELMRLSVAQGLHASSWDHLADGSRLVAGANVARQAGLYMMVQVEPGHMCPITMTNACVPTLHLQDDLARQWLPLILSRQYDSAFKPAGEKRGVTMGMGMTEKQGGTDVRANTTVADPAEGGGPGAEYLITGHKWFFSAPMCDAFFILAQAPGGLSCFLMPRFLPDGNLNALYLQRLKDKVGNRANASSEVEFQRAHAWMVGEEGRGVANIITMASWTRLDCAVASAGLMRQSLSQALHHCRHRQVFGKTLAEQPLMQNVLADLCLEVEAAVALAFRVARAFDEAGDGAGDREADVAWHRLMTPVAKYWNCKRAPGFAHEAMECLGGNGYINDSVSARVYREMPVNAIWEGSGNVMCLDVLRVLEREPQLLDAIMNDLESVRGRNADYGRALERLQTQLKDADARLQQARSLTEQFATVAAASLLLSHSPDFVSETYCRTRLAAPSGLYGCLPGNAPLAAIIDRHQAGR